MVSVTLEALRHLKLDIRNTTVAIQGFGNVGSHTAHHAECGARVVAVSDVWRLYKSSGLDIPNCSHAQRRRDSRCRRRSWETGSRTKSCFSWTARCSCLLPCRADNEVQCSQVTCRVLVEGANGPTTLEADASWKTRAFCYSGYLGQLRRRDRVYFEWVQDVQQFFVNAADIQNRLRDLMTSAFHRTWEFSRAKRTSMRMAALISGIDKVAQAHLHRGLYP